MDLCPRTVFLSPGSAEADLHTFITLKKTCQFWATLVHTVCNLFPHFASKNVGDNTKTTCQPHITNLAP